MRHVMFFEFGEAQGIAPSDLVGTLGDLGIEGVLTPGLASRGWTGGGRTFSPATSTGFIAADNDGQLSLLTRDCTIQAIVSLNLAAAAGQPMTLISRGVGGSDSEYYAFGVELQAAAVAGDVDVRWFWSDQGGTLRTQTAGTFISPGDGVAFLLTCTRRWEGIGRVVVRYFVADHMVAEVVSVDGSIGGGASGHTTIGTRKTSGTFGRYFAGAIEQLSVIEGELSSQQIELTWKRLAKYQPEGVQRWRALQPPGAPWSSDPGSAIGRLIKIWGQLAGLGEFVFEQLGDLLPDRCDANVLEIWETEILKVQPGPIDSLDVRRARVLGLLASEAGYSLPALRTLLAPLFDQDAADVEMLEFTNTISESFSAALDSQRWQIDATAGSSWATAAGELRIQAPNAADLVAVWPMIRTAIPEGDRGQPANDAATSAQIRVVAVDAWPSSGDPLVGLLRWQNYLDSDEVWIGIAKPGASYQLVERRRVAGVWSARAIIATLAGPGLYLRVSRTATPTQYLVEYGTAGFGGAISSATITGPSAPGWVGLALQSTGALGSALDLRVDDFQIRAPNARRIFTCYAYRNPALPGAPDMVGADLLFRSSTPARNHAAAISTKSLLCGNLNSRCGAGPMGGF